MADYNITLVKALASHIAAGVAALQQVTEEWPTPNVMLKLPAVSITTVRTSIIPYQTAKQIVGTVDETDPENINASVLHVVGHFDTELQIDVWAKSKPERATLSDSIRDIMNPSLTPAGLRLTLSAYENQVADILITEQRYADGQGNAQTQEWRTVFKAVATCPMVRRTTENVITSTETVFDTPSEIN